MTQKSEVKPRFFIYCFSQYCASTSFPVTTSPYKKRETIVL